MKLIKKPGLFKSDSFEIFTPDAIGKLTGILRLNKLNKIYSSIHEKEGIEFIDALIKKLEIKYEVHPNELSRIPKEGPFIIVSNYPFGGLDGLLLIKILFDIRPDIKSISNLFLKSVDPISQFFFSVNIFDKRSRKFDISGYKKAFEYLHKGHPVAIFPAGDVAKYNAESNTITDRPWQDTAVKFVKKAKVPVVPVYFHGTNSNLFHFLGMVHPLLKTFRMSSELLNKKNKNVKIRIGAPISVEEQNNFTQIDKYGRYLRAKTFALDSPIEIKKFFNTSLFREKKEHKIIDAVSSDKIEQEVQQLKKDYLLFQSQNFQVFCAPSIEMPNILTEIGRLREITFREVGEGTNRSSDIDEFDLYYYQLFIYDEDQKKISGAYRVGKGKDIMMQYGVKGFYVQSLFKIYKPLYSILNETIELGRSFIVKEYQRRPMSLFLLWKGILYFLLKNPEYRYLLGPVSISNQYSKISKNLIIEFLKQTVYNYELAQYIKPRKKFVAKDKFDTEIVLENVDKDINKIDKFISEIEPTNYKMPILLKKYLQLNAKIIGFNIDPKFNNALDGLVILDLFDVPHQTIKSLSKEINDDSILDRFKGMVETEMDV